MALITGTANPEMLTGTIAADDIRGLGSDDVLYGFDGNDSLFGDEGDDLLYGGSGNDLMNGGAGEDLFFGQSGRDTVTYATAAAGLTLNLTEAALSTGDAAGDWFLSIENFVLTAFNDTFIGSAFGDQAQGGLGDDLMRGLAGNDSLLGEVGNDVLEGGSGSDTLIGGIGRDTASYSQAGTAVNIDLRANPLTFGGEANGDIFTSIEVVQGSSFHDHVVLANGVTAAQGGAGNDSLTGGAAAETLEGQGGDDSLLGGGGADLLLGGEGNDRFLGGAGADTLDGGTGGAGVDTVIYTTKVTLNLLNTASGVGEALGDVLLGIEALRFDAAGSVYVGGTQDLDILLTGSSLTCHAGAGAESFSVNGFGTLSVSYLGTTTAVTLTYLGGGVPDGGTILQGTGGASGDMLRDVSNLTLTNLSDTITMDASIGLYDTAAPLTLKAGLGNDNLGLSIGAATLIDGGGGNDTIMGFLVQGTVTGGLGRDVINLSWTGVAPGDVTLSGGDGNDQITSSGHNLARLEGGAGNDSLSVTGDSTSATVLGGIGDDTITASVSIAHGGIAGDAGNDVISATATAGSILGGEGEDSLTFTLVLTGAGTAGADGGVGNDTISIASIFPGSVLPGNTAEFIGGAGDDSLTDLTDSGFVSTSFIFGAGWGDDSITGFSDGGDHLVFEATSGPSGFGDLVVTGNDSLVSIGFGSDSIQLLGFDIADFGADDVLFL